MRFLLAVFALLLSTIALADNRPVNGYGNSSGFCYENDFFCIDNLKRNSRQNATEDAAQACQIYNHGVADAYSPYCYDTCNPSYIPPGSQNPTYVSCRSDCTVRCEIQAPNPEDNQ